MCILQLLVKVIFVLSNNMLEMLVEFLIYYSSNCLCSCHLKADLEVTMAEAWLESMVLCKKSSLLH